MKNKIIAVILCIIMTGGLMTGCTLTANANAKPINSKKLLQDTKGNYEVEELDSAYVKGLNAFAYDIYNELENEDNLFVSPYSISLALSMLYNSADGDTRTEMATLFQFDRLPGYTQAYSAEANQYMNANTKYLLEELYQADSKVDINIANSIWLSENMELKDTAEASLLAPSRNYFKADIFQVDFDKEETLDKVNKWVSDQTEGMIDPFLKQFSDKYSLQMFLANAIYFNGKWSKPFRTSDTKEVTFHGRKSSNLVAMMHMNREKYRYYNDKGIRAIEIPYGEERLVMDVFIPQETESFTIDELYGKLSGEEISEFLRNLDSAPKVELATVALPKFEMEYGLVSLNSALQNLGLETAFREGIADFSLVGDNLYISQVWHKAKIEVEEWGTKAAAATGLEVNFTSAPIEEPMRFIVDVPFVFFIRDKETNAILFMGEINDL